MGGRSMMVVVVLAATLAACAEMAPERPPPVASPRPVPAEPTRFEIAAVPPSQLCASPYPIDAVQAFLIQGSRRRQMNERQDMYGRSLFGIRTTFGELTPELRYDPPRDSLAVLGKELIVDVTVNYQGAQTARLVVRPDYGCPQMMNLAGRAGRPGWQDTPAEDGETGPQVRAAVGYVSGPAGEKLVIVRVDDGAGMRGRTVFRADGPPLQIIIDGGPGGPVDPRRSAIKGLLGKGRLPFGGAGGDGGSAEVRFDRSFPELERKVVIVNRGGGGGPGVRGYGRPGRPGPFPQATAAPVETLFADELAHGIAIRRGAATTATSSN